MKKDNWKSIWREKIVPLLRDPLFLNKWVDPYYEREDQKRISARLNNRGFKWVGYNYHGKLFMFLEDMHLGIMPYSLTRSTGQFSVNLVPSDSQLENVLAEALDHKGYRHRLSEAVCEFIRNATYSIFMYGQVVYEIVYEKDSSGNLIRLEFLDIHPLSIKRIFGSYYQFIPWWVAKGSGVRAGIKKIPREKIMFIKFPRELGGRRKLVHILKTLSSLDKAIVPEFYMKAFAGNENIGFDFNEYVRAKYLESAKVTRNVGWNQRKFRDTEILEYYSMYRHLRFAFSQALIREHLLKSVNQVLNSQPLNLSVQIVIEGVPKSSEIMKEFNRLQAGDLSFTDLMKRTNTG